MEVVAPSPMDAGAMVTDQLQLVRALEKGSMGSVWVAFDHALQTEVAIKFMEPGLAADETFVERVVREARAAAQMCFGSSSGGALR